MSESHVAGTGWRQPRKRNDRFYDEMIPAAESELEKDRSDG